MKHSICSRANPAPSWAGFSRSMGALVLLLGVLGAACAAPGGGARGRAVPPEIAAPPSAVAAQTLGAGDVFEVRVVGEKDLSGDHRVAADGSVTFPFCGKVDARGTTTELAARLTACLQEGYLKDPQVTVFLKELNSQKVFVFGEVNKPGTFPYEDKMSVVQAITLAGGFTKQAAKNSVLVTRTIEDREHRIRVGVDDIGMGRRPNFRLLPGDIIYVSESFF